MDLSVDLQFGFSNQGEAAYFVFFVFDRPCDYSAMICRQMWPAPV
jgi:hypothetical protein